MIFLPRGDCVQVCSANRRHGNGQLLLPMPIVRPNNNDIYLYPRGQPLLCVPVMRQVSSPRYYEALPIEPVQVMRQLPAYDLPEKKTPKMQPVPNYKYRLEINENFPGRVTEIKKVTKTSFTITYELRESLAKTFGDKISKAYIFSKVYDSNGEPCGTIGGITYKLI